MVRDLDWKELSVEHLQGEDAKVVKAFVDARIKLEEHVQKKQGPCLFSYKRGGIAFAKMNGASRRVTSLD